MNQSGDRDKIAAACRRAMEEEGLSQAAAAAKIGISDSALSQWLSGKYRGDDQGVMAKIEAWLRDLADRNTLAAQMPPPPEWVDTPTSERITAGLKYAHQAADIAVISGLAGAGKSHTAAHYAASRPNAWTASMTPASRTVAAMLDRIAAACGVRSAGSAARTEAALIARMKGSWGLLIVDEAQHLDRRALDQLRCLHDAALIGIALIGSDALAGRLGADPQINSRVGKRVKVGRPTRKDVRAMSAAWGLDAEARAAAEEIGARPGGIRSVAKSIRMAGLVARGKQPSAGQMRAAASDLGVVGVAA